ncbi:alcohol oxidase [Jaminaea rosea]|uniref:Alcohol oxidase n=1 Tax=Jaminaea rosea TaxID=1569628 RepID=A0A316UPW5_9BASI|nr:alcohol oxidase [Jaminaea rosea]PWN27337.1 alcohol oxidase [Jaminaea rosea]
MRSVLATAAAAVAASVALAAPADPSFEARLAVRSKVDQVIAQRSLVTDAGKFSQKSYDYVIVGAGTAGLALAARLSENGKHSVGVLEAGPTGFNDPIIDIPGQFGADLGTKYDYNYTTDANSQTGVTPKGWPRGHVVGGSSALNFLVVDAASEAEYNAWEELGNKGWNWESMDKYMKKSETFTTPSQEDQGKLNIEVNPDNYGSNGPIQVTFPDYISKQVQNWIPALESLGIPRNNEPLGGKNTGASVQPSDINLANHTRSYSAPAYFYPNSARNNLALLANARVDKINWTPLSKVRSWLHKLGVKQRATGVNFTSGGKSYTVKAKREVIISGGAVNSPQILELSGVGNPSILKQAGIQPVIQNNNVGENLQDHTYSYAAYELQPGNPTLDSLRWNTTFAAEQKALYQQNKVSILGETVPSIAYITLRTLLGESKANQYVETAKSYVQSQSNKAYASTLNKQLEFLQKYPDTLSQMELIGIDGFFAGAGAPENNKNYVTFLSASQHLLARGSVHIKSKSAGAAPSIQPNYYNNDFDLNLAVQGLQYLRNKVSKTQQYSSYITKEVVPGSNYTTDAQLKDFLKGMGTTTEYHPIGSVSMLPQNKGGVVDANLRVYQTENVRVVDASIMPVHISAHIMRTTYGIAEKAADLILGA